MFFGFEVGVFVGGGGGGVGGDEVGIWGVAEVVGGWDA